MKQILLMSLLAISSALSAQKPIEFKLWPNGAPNSNGITTPEQLLENGRISNVSEPTLTVYPAVNPNGLAIVACPGGGYIRLAMNHEGHDMADWFNAQGITYAVLKYRMPNGHHEIPLSDALQAIKLMREHANEWQHCIDQYQRCCQYDPCKASKYFSDIHTALPPGMYISASFRRLSFIRSLIIQIYHKKASAFFLSLSLQCFQSSLKHQPQRSYLNLDYLNLTSSLPLSFSFTIIG